MFGPKYFKPFQTDLQRELRVIAGNDSKAEIASLQKELGELREANQKLDEKLQKVNSDHDRMKSTVQMDESLMIRLKKKLEAAESELKSLKRKWADSISPERRITGILKRPEASSPPEQNVLSSSAQPTPKKSRNRKNRWDDLSTIVPPPLSTGTV
jgi:chromosome segregation ATPase